MATAAPADAPASAAAAADSSAADSSAADDAPGAGAATAAAGRAPLNKKNAKLARRNTGVLKLQKARSKLNIMRILGGPEPSAVMADQMSDDLQQLLNKSVDLYATDVGKWVKVFWTDPILERRVDAISEIGWGAYLCGELLQIDLARSEGFLEGVFKVARTMCGRPVAPSLRATMLHSIGLMCRDCLAFQERALDVGILAVASDYLTDISPIVRKSSASLLFVLFVGHARALQEACSMADLCEGLAKVSRDDWTVGGWSCNEAEQAMLLLALGERALISAESKDRLRIDRDL